MIPVKIYSSFVLAVFLILVTACSGGVSEAQSTIDAQNTQIAELSSTIDMLESISDQSQIDYSISDSASTTSTYTPVSTTEVIPTETDRPAFTPTITSSPIEPPPTNTPSKPKPTMISIVPFNYILEEVGEGWSEGRLTIAFENLTADVFKIERLDLGNITVETEQGATYPVELHIGIGSMEDRRIGEYYNRIDYHDEIQIPPGFRYFYDSTPGSRRWHELNWQSATAATPVRIVFEEQPELNFDLPEIQGSQITFPYEILPGELESLSSLEGVALIDISDQLIATFTGRCLIGTANLIGYSFNDANFLEFTANNRDLYNEHQEKIVQPRSIFYSNGNHEMYESSLHYELTRDYDEEYIELGPGTSTVGYFLIGSVSPVDTDSPPVLVMWHEDGSYTLYEISGCVSE